MTTVEFLKAQLIETRNFTQQLMDEMPDDLWYVIPQNTDANFAWQIGHIYLAQHYHVILCAFGMDKRVLRKIDLKAQHPVFNGLGCPKRSVDERLVSVSGLKENFNFMHELCAEKLSHAHDDLLRDALEPTAFKNPIAKSKYEAIAWSYKHEMWHCAEMEQIKIQLGKQFQWIKN